MTVRAFLTVIRSSVFHSVKRCHSTSKMPSALLILAEGAEEMETVITADVLRRGGVSVKHFQFFDHGKHEATR